VRRITWFVGWFGTLWLLWEVLSGTVQSLEMYAGLAAAGVGALLAEILRMRGLFPFEVDPKTLAKAWRAPALIVLDVGVVTWALLRAVVTRRRIAGEWVEVPYPLREGPRGRWQRLFGVALANGYANSVVTDYRDGRALMHALTTRVITGRSVL
jgi:hypothetical protein